MRAAFLICKQKAKRRKSKRWPDGIPWEITFAAFAIYARRTQYLTQKGNDAGSITIDRKDSRKGYVPGNLRPLTRRQNALNGAKEQFHRMENGYSWKKKH